MKFINLASPELGKRAVFLQNLFFILIPAIGLIDYWTGPAITFALFYLFPVSAIAWLGKQRDKIVLASGLTVITWILVDYFSSRFSPSFLAYLWNFFSRFTILLIITTLIETLKQYILKTHQLSIHDPLTNALNNRGFMDLAEREVYRSKRSGSAMTLVFLDVDNFKSINDKFGHNAGDRLLKSLVEFLQLHIRQGDLIGRVGGDEFVILFPETGQDSAKFIVNKIRSTLMEETAKHLFPVTFSMGVLTCVKTPESMEEMIGMADKLMYEVKSGQKNDVIFLQYPD